MKLIKLLSLIILFSSSTLFSQQKKDVFIVVKDQKNKVIPGAIILFDDVRQPAKTNSKGIFKGSVKGKLSKITAFSPLHGIKTISYSGKKYNRVVITKQMVKASIEKPSNVITQESVSSFQYKDIYDYINGQVPGVRAVNGAISIRGNNTINGSSAPLLIVNNSPVTPASFGLIYPADIKFIKVLKGPDASLYGIRGANGVIEVTTK